MKKLAFVFPGQGSQYVGMGRELAERFPVVREVFAEADAALQSDLTRLCFEGPEEVLRQTVHTQPAILTVSCALLRLFEHELAIRPAWVAGHSLGEYAALVAAGVLDFATAVRTVRERGRLMEEAVPAGRGGMAAVLGLSGDEVAALCAAERAKGLVVEPATLNGPGQTVVAGETAAVAALVEAAKAAGARRAVELSVSGPFHSSLLIPAGEQLRRVLALVELKDPAVPVVANVTARPVHTASEVEEALVAQVSSAVRWEESVRYMIDQGVDTFLEIGPGNVLAGLVRRIDRKVTTLNLDDGSSWDKVLAWSKGDGIR